MSPISNRTMVRETDPAAVPRARRASRPKSKLGCQQCKTRRIKCDEARPRCHNCVKSGRDCGGYPAWNPRSRAGPYVEMSSVPIAPRPSISGSSSDHESRSTTAAALSPPLFSALTASPPPIHSSEIFERGARNSLHVVNSPLASSPSTYLPFLYSPVAPSSFTGQEAQYYQVFRTRTANELSGFFDSDFWTRSVLQESHAEASIRHAVIALGALYKTQDKLVESPPGSPDKEGSTSAERAPNHYKFALEQYGKSLSRLREALGTKEIRSRRTLLMSVVLFTCFQSFTGDHTSAITQIQHGLRLLSERQAERRKPAAEREDVDDVEAEITQIFTRLAIQAKSYDMAFHFPQPYVIRLSDATDTQAPTVPVSEVPVPEVFSTVQQARCTLDNVLERLIRFNEALSSVYMGPNNILPDQIRSTGIGFQRQLEAWQVAFSPLLLNRRRPGVTNMERAGINVLRMTQLMSMILLVMNYSTSEKDFDEFGNEFKEIIQLAMEVVVDEEISFASARCGTRCRHRSSHHASSASSPEQGSYSHIKASFALDLGIVPPLFVVGTKCRDRKLRREAINLLSSSPRREGLWDSALCGRVASWIMAMEEEGLPVHDPKLRGAAGLAASAPDRVPDARRVMVKEILFDMQTREATLRCGTRGAREGEHDAKARETQISW